MRKIAFMTVLWLVSPACDNRHNTVAPEQAAQKWVSDLGLKIQGQANCAQVDSDNDGYVTCTVALAPKDEKSQPETISLQCAGITGDGCESQTNKYVMGCKKTEPKLQQVTQ